MEGRDECGIYVDSSPFHPHTNRNQIYSGNTLPNYNDESVRLKSFENWPSSLPIKPKELIENGFYYNGKWQKLCCLKRLQNYKV